MNQTNKTFIGHRVGAVVFAVAALRTFACTAGTLSDNPDAEADTSAAIYAAVSHAVKIGADIPKKSIQIQGDVAVVPVVHKGKQCTLSLERVIPNPMPVVKPRFTQWQATTLKCQ